MAEKKKGMSEGEKAESVELEELIRRVREQNAEEEFEGFD